MKKNILKALRESKGEFISGQDLSDKLGVSRTSIWKHINQLKEEGYKVDSVTRRGYRLREVPDSLTEEEVRPYLDTALIGNKIIHHDSIDSTNEGVKKIASGEKEGLVLTSEEQVKGKGRLGRVWSSSKGKGIYMSILLKPEIYPQDATKITQLIAAATIVGLKKMGVRAEIKWPNDIIINSKKVAGILTEMSGELMRVDYIVVGIGINVNNTEEDFPSDIREKASSIRIEVEASLNRANLMAEILNAFERLYLSFLEDKKIDKAMEICKESSVLLGKEVRVISRGEEKIRKAIDLGPNGELIVEDREGNIEEIVSGEVSIRGLDGYI